ncbi:MAG: excinuclease ABC subunit UvrA [Deltaproteobacteria bacterium]|nr:excinuclease ABC subunit UvrA [Deltaproteobacteria bacterium]
MSILIEGARVHNLKNVDVEIPRGKLVVITGVSGSGKSSLAFDTVYAEGQRHYMQSLSTYARQLLNPLARADVDSIRGLSPAIAVPQRRFHENPRSTVGTLTEIHDHLRLLFTHVGRAHCLRCGRPIVVHTVQQMVDAVLERPAGARIEVLAPLRCGGPDEFRREVERVVRAGFVRVKVDGEVAELAEMAEAAGSAPPDRVELVVDRLVAREGIAKRLADSLEVALEHGDGVVAVEVRDGAGAESCRYTQRAACLECGTPFPETVPQLFSFNSPHGACPACGGLGVQARGRSRKDDDGSTEAGRPPCAGCHGTRLRPESLKVKIGGLHIAQVSALPLNDLYQFIQELTLEERESAVAGNVLREIRERTDALLRLELGYMTLARPSDSLSGGECQRIRLAAHIGARLSGVIYVLDEPTVGLHPRDTARLLDILRQLKDAGNTVLVVEHDRDVILAADHVIDMGPGAGVEGGEVLATGSVEEIRANPASRTGPYLAGAAAPPSPRRRTGTGTISIKNATRHNLKHIDVDFPMGAMTCVTGVSGSGKSSLVADTLYEAAQRHPRHAARAAPRGPTRSSPAVAGLDAFDRVLYVDQASIGRNSRSTPATYGGLFDPLRNLFARLPEARLRGYGAGRFSYNAAGGRCEACQGAGTADIEMQFLPDVSVTCDVCGGRRYNRETLEIRYKGASIADVLDLTVTEALELLGNVPLVRARLETLWQVGLGYLRLGQPATTLSGGEAQRVKLARELSKRPGGRALYLFDEPTTGLHFEEVTRLVEILDRLVEAGHTVIAIEHNPDFLRCADYIVDLGPEGGENGGHVVASGTPEEVMRKGESATGQCLRELQSPDRSARA